MLEHHLQQSIVTRLKSVNELTFTGLKPPEIENKLFTYHLKIVNENGSYSLTPAGEKLWRRMSETTETIALRPFSVLFLIIRHTEHGWLLYRRKTHPVKDRTAFMHCIPEGTRPILETASLQTKQKTGLDCDFRVVGSGFFHTFDSAILNGFTNFTLLACERAEGQLTVDDEFADYFWLQNPHFDDHDMLPNMKALSDAYLHGDAHFFLDNFVTI
jgi:hypothetical protein